MDDPSRFILMIFGLVHGSKYAGNSVFVPRKVRMAAQAASDGATCALGKVARDSTGKGKRS